MGVVMRLFKNVAIVGVGLIGGSIGLAIKKKGLADKVIGIGRRRESLNEALAVGAVDQAYLGLENIKGADLVVLAAPVREIIKIIPQLPGLISKDCVVIDAGSTKSEILKTAQRYKLNFIGAHPLAGMEKKGPKYARAGLFENSWCLLVPAKTAKAAALKKIEKLWVKTGARIKIISARDHDRILAYTSHLPHLVVFGLLDCLKRDYLEFAASGLKDTTRIGLSDPLLWRDIFLTNRKEVLKAIKAFKKSLARLEETIAANHPGKLVSCLESSRNKRNAF